MIQRAVTPDRRNVLGQALESCSKDPMTGFFRDGCCRTDENDMGSHTVCIRVSAEFLVFSARVGNNLSTPMPEYGFDGLKPGDQWCLCAERWQEAFVHGAAPPVVLGATHERALEVITLEDLRAHAFEG
jgi:uncharacterized protein